MTRAFAAARRYPLVLAALLIGAAGLVLLAVDLEPWARIGISVFAGAVALKEGIEMARALASGRFGLDILAVTAIVEHPALDAAREAAINAVHANFQ